MKKDFSLSHSSVNKLISCEQKFVYYKNKEKPDTVTKSDSLIIGSSFHWVLEQTLHKRPRKMSKYLNHCIEVGFENKETGEHDKLPSDYSPLVAAMILKYCDLHEQSGLEVLAVEVKGQTEFWIGFIDVVLGEKNGSGWWIGDLKTATYFKKESLPALVKDPQLNLYAAHAEIIGKQVNRDPKDFLGCRYRATTKSKLVRRNGESVKDYCLRLYKNSIKSYDVIIPIGLMSPQERLDIHLMAYDIAAELRKEGTEVFRNYNSCLEWNRPCEYWSKCFGESYSRMTLKGLKVLGGD